MLALLVAVLAGPPSPERVDVEEFRGALKVWTDGHGHYVAATADMDHVFYGDGKTFYQSSPYSWSSAEGVGQATLRDQRFERSEQTELQGARDGTLTVTCAKRKTLLTSVEPDKAKPMLDAASFNRTPHSFIPYYLARDDRGTYYFVDHGRFPDNERVFRVFSGQRGNMKELKLKNIVHDSTGDVFATPSGDLRLVASSATGPEWVRREVRTKLIAVPIEDNVPFIYNELGAYAHVRLGSPCDDL
jgi:hypothetical protein